VTQFFHDIVRIIDKTVRWVLYVEFVLRHEVCNISQVLVC